MIDNYIIPPLVILYTIFITSISIIQDKKKKSIHTIIYIFYTVILIPIPLYFIITQPLFSKIVPQEARDILTSSCSQANAILYPEYDDATKLLMAHSEEYKKIKLDEKNSTTSPEFYRRLYNALAFLQERTPEINKAIGNVCNDHNSMGSPEQMKANFYGDDTISGLQLFSEQFLDTGEDVRFYNIFEDYNVRFFDDKKDYIVLDKDNWYGSSFNKETPSVSLCYRGEYKITGKSENDIIFEVTSNEEISSFIEEQIKKRDKGNMKVGDVEYFLTKSNVMLCLQKYIANLLIGIEISGWYNNDSTRCIFNGKKFEMFYSEDDKKSMHEGSN
jgi:hypothetical protein